MTSHTLIRTRSGPARTQSERPDRSPDHSAPPLGGPWVRNAGASPTEGLNQSSPWNGGSFPGGAGWGAHGPRLVTLFRILQNEFRSPCRPGRPARPGFRAA